MTPEQRSMVVNTINHSSEENFIQRKSKKPKPNSGKAPVSFINVQSGALTNDSDDYAIGSLKKLLKTQMSKVNDNIRSAGPTTITTGAISEVSTTVRAPSLHKRGMISSSIGQKFAELGVVMINDTPKSKRSQEF